MWAGIISLLWPLMLRQAMRNVANVWNISSKKLQNVPRPIARTILSGESAIWAECLTARISGVISKREIFAYIAVRGRPSTTFIRCMQACVMHGYIVAMSRQRIFFCNSAIGQSMLHRTCLTNRWNRCLAMSMAV